MFGLLAFIPGRIQLYIAAAIAITGIYLYWEHTIEQRALMEYNQKQLEQSLEDQRKLKENLDALAQKQNDIIKQNDEDRKAYDGRLSVVADYLDSSATKKSDSPSSDILKKTVKQLKEISK